MTTLKENMSKAVCLFLAEMLRTRKVKLDRCADIAAEIVNRLESIGSEKQFLDAVKELEFEFQELKTLKNDLLQVTSMSSRQQMEQIVREYAIQILPHDPKQQESGYHHLKASGCHRFLHPGICNNSVWHSGIENLVYI